MKFCPKCNEEVGNDSTTFCPRCYTKLEIVEHKKQKTKDKEMIRHCIWLCVTALYIIYRGISFIKPEIPEYMATIENLASHSNTYNITVNVDEIAKEANLVENIFGIAFIVVALIAISAIILITKKKKIGAFISCGSVALVICLQIVNYVVLRGLFDKINPEIIYEFPTNVVTFNCAMLFLQIGFFKDSFYFYRDK